MWRVSGEKWVDVLYCAVYSKYGKRSPMSNYKLRQVYTKKYFKFFYPLVSFGGFINFIFKNTTSKLTKKYLQEMGHIGCLLNTDFRVLVYTLLVCHNDELIFLESV